MVKQNLDVILSMCLVSSGTMVTTCISWGMKFIALEKHVRIRIGLWDWGVSTISKHYISPYFPSNVSLFSTMFS